MDNMKNMNKEKLTEIISKFEMPKGEYIIEKHSEFDESEFYWIIKNKENYQSYFLVCSYWHPGVEKEMAYYKKSGIAIKKPILRNAETLEIAGDKEDPIKKYLFYDLYAIFSLQ